MCFSAQCWQAFDAYVREFGALIDIHEFAQLYGFRKEHRKATIPKGMDRNFDRPKSDVERQIKALIDEWYIPPAIWTAAPHDLIAAAK